MALERVEVKNPVGVNTSFVSGDLPLNVWSSGNNIRFKNGRVQKAQGYSSVFTPPGTGVLGLLPYLSDNIPYWFMGLNNSLWRTEGGTPVNVTRPVGGLYNASPDNPWNGGVLHKVAVMNNGVDVPQSFVPTGSSFTNLPNWPALTFTKILRPFKNYLVALNVTKNSIQYPTMVKWSSPADPGNVPFTWDETDPTNDAGENSLADTAGAIVDGVKLRDSFIIYKEDSSYLMRYIGGVYIFSFQQLFNDIGILATNCAAEFNGNHFVIGIGDVYVHNGVQKRSVIDGKNKEFLFNSIKATAVHRTFVVPDYNRSEMWICYCSHDSPDLSCDKALVWNWDEDTWAPRDIPRVFCGAVGIVDPQVSNAWNEDSGVWNTDTTLWNEGTYNPSKTTIVLSTLALGVSRLYQITDTSLFDGQPFTSYVERTGVYLDDNRNMKTISALIPHMAGNGLSSIYIGTSTTQNGPIDWRGPMEFSVANSYKVDCKKVGRYVSVRFEFPSEGTWSLNGYTVEFAPTAGMR